MSKSRLPFNNVNPVQRHCAADVVVLGCGGAGVSAALEAREHGVHRGFPC